MGNGTNGPDSFQAPDRSFPVYAAVLLAVALFTMTSAFLYHLCRCLVRKKMAPPPKVVGDPRMAGVRANHPIEFVVPTTSVFETTEDSSVSDTDYYSSKRKFHIDPSHLQHGLYEEKGIGKVGFSLRYDLRRSQLTVKVIGARDLPLKNPCVKVVLLPERTARYVTKVAKNVTDPDFNESFSFCVRSDELRSKRLKVSVWDYDRFSRKCLVGQVFYDVKDAGLTDGFTSGEMWVELRQESKSQTVPLKGEMLISLCYDPDSSILTLSVLKVRGLDMQQDKGKETTLYAKVTLYVRRKPVRTKKTPCRKKVPHVEFNSPFAIHVPQTALQDVSLSVALCEKWALGGKRVLGRNHVGAEYPSEHWQDMLASPKSTCAQWHALSG